MGHISRDHRIAAFLFILVLIIGVSIKCCTNKKTTNTVFQNMHETATDPEKTVENTSTELDNDDSKNSTEYSKNNTSSENKSNSSARNTGSTNKPSSGSNNGGTTNKPSSSSGNTNKPSSGSNNSNNGNSSNNKPPHTHNWVNVTKTVNHPAETHQEDVYEDRQVKVKDAWDEQVKMGSTAVCRQCGYRTTDNNAMDMHCLEEGHSSTWETNYTTVHHDAVYETQRVKVGTKTIVDKAAWAETVVTGQKCSSCGETK